MQNTDPVSNLYSSTSDYKRTTVVRDLLTNLNGTVQVNGRQVEVKPVRSSYFDAYLMKTTTRFIITTMGHDGPEYGPESTYENLPTENQLQPILVVNFETNQQAISFAQLLESDLPLQLYYIKSDIEYKGGPDRSKVLNMGLLHTINAWDVKINRKINNDSNQWTGFKNLGLQTLKSLVFGW